MVQRNTSTRIKISVLACPVKACKYEEKLLPAGASSLIKPIRPRQINGALAAIGLRPRTARQPIFVIIPIVENQSALGKAHVDR